MSGSRRWKKILKQTTRLEKNGSLYQTGRGRIKAWKTQSAADGTKARQGKERADDLAAYRQYQCRAKEAFTWNLQSNEKVRVAYTWKIRRHVNM
jgi:hypothetical protein